MPIEGEILYRDRESILTQMTEDIQALVSDVYLGPDGNLMILLQITAGVEESIFLANQILSEDMFIVSANPVALDKWGEEFGVPKDMGEFAVGELTFSGNGGEYISLDTIAAYDRGAGLPFLYFTVTEDGTIANPGIPSAPHLAVGIAGALTGTYEYAMTFVTASGETALGAISNALAVTAQKINLTLLPLGGPGTTSRKLYRSLNGGDFQLVNTFTTTTTTYTDNSTTPGAVAPTESTAERITLAAVAEQVGSEYNAAVGTITVVAGSDEGLISVTNESPFTGGDDPEETETYRRKVQTRVKNPQSGSPGDLKEWAEEVVGVETATVYENMNDLTPTNGHVTVRIAGPGGAIPAADVIAATQLALDSQDIANIIIHVLTFTAQTRAVSVTLTFDTAVYVLADLAPQVAQAITDYINSLEVGEKFRKNGVVDAVFGLNGVQDVTVTTPSADANTTSNIHKWVPGVITVS